METGRGNRNIRRKPSPVSLCPSQILHYLTRARIRAVELRILRITATAMTAAILLSSPQIKLIILINICENIGL
jgi:hypothetical protein